MRGEVRRGEWMSVLVARVVEGTETVEGGDTLTWGAAAHDIHLASARHIRVGPRYQANIKILRVLRKDLRDVESA